MIHEVTSFSFTHWLRYGCLLWQQMSRFIILQSTLHCKYFDEFVHSVVFMAGIWCNCLERLVQSQLFLYMYKVQYLFPLVQRSDEWNFCEISFMATLISYVTHLKEIVLIRYFSLDLNIMHNVMYGWEQLPIHLSSNELTWSVCSLVNILFFTFSQKPLTISN